MVIQCAVRQFSLPDLRMDSHPLLQNESDVSDDAETRELKQSIVNILQNPSLLFLHAMASNQVHIYTILTLICRF